MPEDVRMWVEITFNVAYLVVVWGLVVMMRERRSVVGAGDRQVADLVLWAFTLLAVGDTGHVGFRVLAFALGDLETRFSVSAQAFTRTFGSPIEVLPSLEASAQQRRTSAC